MEDTKLRIMLINLHGLIKGDGLEIGRDADNGGQTRYVYELAEAMSRHPEVGHIHLFTRLIEDPKVSDTYALPVEVINEKLDIRRIGFGGKRYRKKEELWEYLDEFVYGAIKHIKKDHIFPDWISSHYGDAAYAAVELSRMLHIPFSHTGHSLGRAKKANIEAIGIGEAEGEKLFKFSKRIAAEESALKHATFVITSTEQEIESYEGYENADKAQFHVLAPGVDTHKFLPYYQPLMQTDTVAQEALQRRYWVAENIEKFLSHPAKPVILALSRPDRRKNLHTLIEVYGEEKELQGLANLVIFAGIRKDINLMPDSEKDVLIQILLQLDKYDLYGKLAIPKKHDIEHEVAAIYQYSAEKRGVFVNLTLHENFGLTLIEAASSGLPVVATNSGGPTEILPKCGNGILVDPMDKQQIKQAIIELLSNEEHWKRCSNNGILNVEKYYSWDHHVHAYLEWVRGALPSGGPKKEQAASITPHPVDRLKHMNRLFVSDIDGTLIAEAHGHPGLEKLRQLLTDRPADFGFAVASGRNIDLVREAIQLHGLPTPDFIICSVGSQICLGLEPYIMDKSWASYLNKQWRRSAIVQRLHSLKWLALQETEAQNPHKISYYFDPETYDGAKLNSVLGKHAKHITLIRSHDRFLDILPRRASKGKALKYICKKWNIPLKHVVAAGDSGNDLDMLQGSIKGILVGNRSPEMQGIRPGHSLYLAEAYAAAGILEGFEYFGIKI